MLQDALDMLTTLVMGALVVSEIARLRG